MSNVLGKIKKNINKNNPSFEEVKAFVIKTDNISASKIQREFNIGYA